MNKTRRKELDKIQDQLMDLQTALEELKDEEQECYDNLPESIQNSDRRLPLVVSTNLTSAEIGERYGQRTLDRIREMSVGIKYDGQSYRK